MVSRTRTGPGRARDKRQKKKGSLPGWIAWWPVLAGIAVTPFALKTAEILPLMGPDGLMKLRLLFPYSLILQQHQLGLSETGGNSLSQGMLYAQFPLYGLYMMLAMKWKPWWTALLQVFAIHLLGFAALWLLARK